MMHIVHIIDLLRVGGAQKLLLTFGKAIRDREGIQCTIVSLSADHDSAIPDELRALGLKVEHFPGANLFDFGRLRRLSRFLRIAQCDVVQTHLTYANILGALAGRSAGLPVAATLHSTKIDSHGFSQLREWLESLALRCVARRVVAVGHLVEATHRQRLHGRSIDVIPNGVTMVPTLSAEERRRVRAEIAGDPARPLLICVGRLTEQKGHDDLLVAFKRVCQTHASALLLIVGEGKLQARLVAQIAAQGLEDRVRLLGLRHDIPRLLAASDLFVCSSHWEGLPLAVLEAMSAGLPVISTSVGDIPKAVVEGTGILVPPHAPALLAEALLAMLADPACIQTLGHAARAHVEQHYNHTVWLEQLLRLYAQARTASCATSAGDHAR